MSRRRRSLLGLAVVSLAIAVAALAIARGEAPAAVEPGDAIRNAGGRAITYERAFGIDEHVAGRVRYPTNPPLNGPHAPVAAQDGNYAGVSTPPTEELVHSLEHGRVHIQYRRGLAAAAVAELEALFDESPYHVLLYANTTGMRADVGVTAWGRGALFDRYSSGVVDGIRAFRDAYRDRGPEFVP